MDKFIVRKKRCAVEESPSNSQVESSNSERLSGVSEECTTVSIPVPSTSGSIIKQCHNANNNKSKDSASDTSDSESNSNNNNDPSPAKRKRSYKQQFKQEWLLHYSWLECKDGQSYCKYCASTLKGSKSHLERHQKRSSHIKIEKEKRRTPDVRNLLLEPAKYKTMAKQVKEAEFILCMGIVEHNLPFLFMDRLPKLIQTVAPDSEILKNLNCGRTKATKIITTFGNEFKEIIGDHLKLNKFSMIADETTDISVKKCLAVLARYKQKNVIKDRLLSFLELTDFSAEAITNSITELLLRLNIPLKNLIGFAADNAAVMLGNINGVQAKLKSINPDIFVIGCVCHSMALCASNAAKKLPAELEEFIRNIYNYISQSSKRLLSYNEFQEFVNLKPHKILKLSQTRWLSLEKVVTCVLNQWAALKLFFQLEAAEEKMHSLNQIDNAFTEGLFKIYLTFLQYILPMINKINLELQSETPQICHIYNRISSVYKTILKNFMNRNYVDNTDLLRISPLNSRQYLPDKSLYFGEKTAQLLEDTVLSTNQKIEISNNCLAYYVELCLQIRSRFSNLEEYKNFGLLNPERVLNELNTLTPLLKTFKHLTNNNEEEISSEYREISSLSENIKEKLKKLDFESFWVELYSLKNSSGEVIFGNICQFVFNILSLPHSSAAAERIFSQLNLIKSKTRNRLLPETCNSLLLSKELLDGAKCFGWKPSDNLLKKNIVYN